jgi:hypothetical protein
MNKITEKVMKKIIKRIFIKTGGNMHKLMKFLEVIKELKQNSNKRRFNHE